jgi:transcriptional regulator GlxA family with amidase domain
MFSANSTTMLNMRSSMVALPPRRIAFLATPNAQALEVAGPIEVFAMAERKLREAGRGRTPAYVIDILSTSRDLNITSASGLCMSAQRSYRAVTEPIDTLLVAGGLDLWSAKNDPTLLSWLRKQAKQARRIGSVCTGAFLLAEAGVLDGRRVTTHWFFCQELQKRFPKLTVDPEPIFIREGNLSTSAGVTAGLDLAIAMVEEDLGLDIALRVARALVLFLRRSEGQSQFSTSLAFQATSRLPLREIPVFILENLNAGLSVEALAARVAMSQRNFSRIFRQEFGETPASFVDRLRLDTAKRLIEESDRTIDDIAEKCGFGSSDTMRRAFQKRYGHTPASLRR